MTRIGALALVTIALAGGAPAPVGADGVARRDVASDDVAGPDDVVSRGVVSDTIGHRGAIISAPQTMSADVNERGRPNITIYVDPMSAGVNGNGAADANDMPANPPPRPSRRRYR